MPPKKKAKTPEEENQIKPAEKLQPPPPVDTKEELKPELPKTVNPAPTNIIQSSQQPKQEDSEVKVQLQPVKKLSAQQLIELRKLRFHGIGTDKSLAEADKIKEERLKKFGGINQTEERKAIESRKLKFGNNIVEDSDTIKKRLQKFGNVVNEPEDLVEKRKQKFGSGGITLSLDDQISKTKKIHKQFPHKKHHGNPHQNFNNRFRN